MYNFVSDAMAFGKLRVHTCILFDNCFILWKMYMMLFAIWYHLYNLKCLKNTQGGVLLLVSGTLLKVPLLCGCFSALLSPPWVFFIFVKLEKWTELRKASCSDSSYFQWVLVPRVPNLKLIICPWDLYH